MQLFIDIDGVLLNFERAFVSWLNREHALGLPDTYEAESWDFTEVLEGGLLLDSWHRFLDSDGAGRMIPLVDPEHFNGLCKSHDVHLVTNFPGPFMDKRLDNLAEVGFVYDSLHYCGIHPYKDLAPASKAETIAGLRSNGKEALFVDDHPDNCLDVHANCPDVEVWLMSRRFNRDFSHPEITRTQGWEPLFRRLGHPNGNDGGDGSEG